LYKIKFNPVLQDKDSAFFVDKDMPEWLFRQMDMRKMIIELAGGPVRRLAAKLYIKNKSDDDLRELISSQKPKDVLIQQKKVAEAVKSLAFYILTSPLMVFTVPMLSLKI
jgi:hypothetical protein